ncbi:nitroreductase family protein [Paenibacillus macquariensis]|uniref:Nitroreductase n=1 Tax=Paenibacillus macquariensis TaxID=948756 RepID=A0ABY1JWU6_9BACL|nr:nitroreductase family protein [Paenibacillus macquariensis]MEC0089412.1 nitroreductase family protein [Paenibacillus macquariensis]OAB33201.1 NAD(P)H nitroreductase [Paenibacillus macquariensis subsp. macquariensis]SIQ91802.1 Nitroreductase [Paenibacillus macquariensis]
MTNTALQVKQDFDTVIRDRHSVRKYDASWKMSEDEIKEILSDAVLAPSSSNLQPWRFIVIQDQSLKEQLLPIANNQQQIIDASAVIAVIGDLNAYENVEKIHGIAVDAGVMTPEIKDMMVTNTMKVYPNVGAEKLKEIALVDGGLVSMQLMLAAKAKGYDTVPMGGYNAVQFKEMFNISDRYTTVMLIALGKAAVEGRQSVRLPLEDVVSWNEFKN